MNWVNARDLKKIIQKNNYNYSFDKMITNRLVDRASYDHSFQKRRGNLGSIIKLIKYFKIHHLFTIFPISFHPYLKFLHLYLEDHYNYMHSYKYKIKRIKEISSLCDYKFIYIVEIPNINTRNIAKSTKSSMFSKNLSIFLKLLGAVAPSLSVRGRGETDYIYYLF